MLMDEGDEHPVLVSGNYSWSEDTTCHYLTFVVTVKGTDIKLSFLIESGFAPVIGDNN